jgi:hypothetical protein
VWQFEAYGDLGKATNWHCTIFAADRWDIMCVTDNDQRKVPFSVLP